MVRPHLGSPISDPQVNAIHDRARHYDFIDGVRGLAACAVMLQHGLNASGLQSVKPDGFGLAWLNLGEVGVVAFFFVSGFVIPLSLEKWDNVSHFWINRAFRIYPLYWVVYLVGAAVTTYGGLSLSQIPQNFLAHLFFVQEFFDTPNFVNNAWTLSLEAVWYIGFTFLFLLSLNRKAGWFSGLAIAAALLAGAISLAEIVRMPMGRVGMLVICVFGLLCFRKERGDIGDRVFLWASVALTAAIFFCLVVGFWLRPGASPLTPSLRCVLLSWLVASVVFLVPFLFRNWKPARSPAMRYLGKISYSIYLIHPIVILLVDRAGMSGVPALFLIGAGTIGISALTYAFVERPAIAFSHGLRPAGMVTDARMP